MRPLYETNATREAFSLYSLNWLAKSDRLVCFGKCVKTTARPSSEHLAALTGNNPQCLETSVLSPPLCRKCPAFGLRMKFMEDGFRSQNSSPSLTIFVFSLHNVANMDLPEPTILDRDTKPINKFRRIGSGAVHLVIFTC